jgi:hypothetical protein
MCCGQHAGTPEEQATIIRRVRCGNLAIIYGACWWAGASLALAAAPTVSSAGRIFRTGRPIQFDSFHFNSIDRSLHSPQPCAQRLHAGETSFFFTNSRTREYLWEEMARHQSGAVPIELPGAGHHVMADEVCHYITL